MGGLFDFGGVSFGFGQTAQKAVEEPAPTPKRSHRRTTKCLELSTKYEYRRAFSEVSLLDALGGKFEFKDGHSYNFITGGDVDALSYLKAILRAHKLEYVLMSTWCMAAEDIFQIGEWIDGGLLRKVDFYVGEIFKNQYVMEYETLQDLVQRTGCGRIALFRNHSKIFAGHDGGDFYFGIQTSANINTNPRTENGCITISREIFKFYKEYFDGINSFC